jgi:hypothetical protein
MIAFDCAFDPFTTGMDHGQSESLRLQALRHQAAQFSVVVYDQEARISSLRGSI